MNKRLVRTLVGLFLALLLVLPCLLLAMVFLPSMLLEGMARSMVPTLYPYTSYKTDTLTGGSSYQSKGKIYAINADIQKVRDWMNGQTAGYSMVTLSPDNGQLFSSYERCDRSVISRVLTRLELGPADFGELYPCASVWLSAGISSTAQTTMTILIGYPSR